MNNNNIAAAIAQIKNAGLSRRYMVVLKNYSTLLENILICLQENNYIKRFAKYTHNNKTSIIVHLSYVKKPNFNIGGKSYIVEPTIEDIYNKHKVDIFNMNRKIMVPRAPSSYMHVIQQINIISKGSNEVYSSYSDLIKHRSQENTFGITILTTPAGVMSHVDAIKNKVGGKLLLGVY